MNVELNKKLLDASIKDEIDYDEISSLLEQGADLLGCYDEELGDYVLEEILMNEYDMSNWDSIDKRGKIVDLIEFFISKGFKPSDIEKSSDDGPSIMWHFHFIASENGIQILKKFLDNGLKAEALEDYINHFYTTTAMVGGYYKENDSDEIKQHFDKLLSYGLKMVMLSASYPHILNESEYLRSCIEMNDTNKDNNYDLTKFRDYNNYKYELDTSTCDHLPYGLRNATVRIKDKQDKSIVWVLHI